MANPPIEIPKSNESLFKPLNVLKRNSWRLNHTTKADSINEILKNAIEHGNGNIEIKILQKTANNQIYLSIFNTMKKIDLSNLNFKLIIQKLTTFEASSDTNFHEGLTTIMHFKALLRCKHYFIVNKMSEDGFYQYIESASHFLDDIGDEYQISDPNLQNFAFLKNSLKKKSLKGWEVILFDDSEVLIKNFESALKSFYFHASIPIEIICFGEKVNICRVSWPKGFKLYRNKEILLYIDLEFDDQGEGIIEIFWQLNNKKVFQKLNNTQFNNQHVSGQIILTSINQFANENRLEVAQDVQIFIEKKINDIMQDYQGDQIYLEELSRLNDYKYQYSSYLIDIFDISPRFEINPIAKINNPVLLLEWTDFLYTMDELLNTNKIYQKNLPKLLHHPDKSPKMLSFLEFEEKLKQLGQTIAKFRQIFPKLPLGLKILNGDTEGFLFLSEITDLLYRQKIIQFIDPNLGFHALLNFDNDIPLIYPTNPHFLYLIQDIPYRIIKSEKEFRHFPAINIQKIIQLKDFVINKEKEIPLQIFPGWSHYTRNDGSDKDQLKISPMEAPKMGYKGIKYNLTIFQAVSSHLIWKIPVLYQEDVQEILFQKFSKPIWQNMVLSNYSIFKYTVQLLIQNYPDFPPKNIFPVLIYQPKGPVALYVQEWGIIAFNIIHFPEFNNKLSNILRILDVVAHELAHEFVASHGKSHEYIFEHILHISRGKDHITQQYILELLQNKLKT